MTTEEVIETPQPAPPPPFEPKSAEVLTDQLLWAIKMVTPTVAGKSTLPVLSHILFRASLDEQRLYLASTNLAESTELWIPAKVDADWSLCVPAAEFKDRKARHLGERVVITQDAPDGLTMRGDMFERFEFTFAADEFPVLIQQDGWAGELVVPAELLTTMDRVAYAAADDGARPVLAGIFVELKPQIAIITTADGHRMQNERITFDHATTASLLIPAIWMRIVRQHKITEPVTLRWVNEGRDEHGNTIFARVQLAFGHITLTSGLIVGRFPDYERIIPGKDMWEARMIVKRAALLDTLDALKVKAAAHGGILRLTAEIDSQLLCSVTSGWGKDMKIVASKPVGALGVIKTPDAVRMAIQYGYLKEMVEHIQTDEIALELRDVLYPLLARPVGGGAVQAIVMPMTTR